MAVNVTINAHSGNNSKYNNAVGVYYVQNPEKTNGSTAYQFKSKLEKAMMGYCDKNEKVLKWVYEPKKPIEYIDMTAKDPKTGKQGKKRKYYIDFILTVKTWDNRLQTYYIEVKAHRETQPPSQKSRSLEHKTWAKNNAKWDAAKKFCESKGYKFEIVTEREFGKDY